MDGPSESIQIPLTPEQQQLIQRLSGQFAQALELTPEPGDPTGGDGCGLRFRWRLSTNTGIPRQRWGADDTPVGPPDGAAE